MVTVRSVLSKSVHNACQKFDGLMTRSQIGNLREMTLGMFLGESSRLSIIGAQVSDHVTPRKNTERYSRTLERIDISSCTKRHIACSASGFRNEAVLMLCDGGDMQKKHARVMEHVCKTVDGSNGHAVGRGYPTFACIAYGLSSKRQMPLCHHLYSTITHDFKSQWAEQKSCYEWTKPFLEGSAFDRIYVNDRGGDDEKQFLFILNELYASFLTRIKTGEKSRKLCSMRDGEIDEAISVETIALQMSAKAGAAKQWKNKKIRKICTSRIAWQEVRLPGHSEIPLFLVLVYTEGFAEPMVLLTDIDVRDAPKAWAVFFWYKKRWEVENFFRAIKQQFGAEKFLILSFAAIRALAFVQMLAFSLLLKIREMAQELFVMLFSAFQAFCRKWQRSKESHMDLLHWLREQWQSSSRRESYSYRTWSKRMYDCLSGKPTDSEKDFLPIGKW